MEPINIRWDTGRMTINPEAFFPAGAARIRKLLQTVALDCAHQDGIRMQMARYCEGRAQNILDGRKRLANEAADYRKRAAGLQTPINTVERRITALRALIQEQPRKARELGCRGRLQEEREALKKLKAQQGSELAAFRRKQRELKAAEGLARKLRENAEALKP